LAGSAFAFAADNEAVVAAANKLKESDNYSWKTLTDMGANSQFRPGPTEGKTDKGTTMLTMSFGDNTVEAVIQGDKGAIKTEDGWQSLEEAGQGGGQGPGRFMGRMLRNFRTPGQQVAETCDKVKDQLKKDGDAYVAQLSEDAAKQMMRFGGRRGGGQGQGQGNGPQISNAKGEVKLWITDGMLSKFKVHVTGTMNINGEDREIDRTTTTEIKDVGTTKVEVPDEAKKKLS
jgi:hypothetical protein